MVSSEHPAECGSPTREASQRRPLLLGAKADSLAAWLEGRRGQQCPPPHPCLLYQTELKYAPEPSPEWMLCSALWKSGSTVHIWPECSICYGIKIAFISMNRAKSLAFILFFDGCCYSAFGSAKDGIQDLVYARQVLYHWAASPAWFLTAWSDHWWAYV